MFHFLTNSQTKEWNTWVANRCLFRLLCTVCVFNSKDLWSLRTGKKGINELNSSRLLTNETKKISSNKSLFYIKNNSSITENIITNDSNSYLYQSSQKIYNIIQSFPIRYNQFYVITKFDWLFVIKLMTNVNRILF